MQFLLRVLNKHCMDKGFNNKLHFDCNIARLEPYSPTIIVLLDTCIKFK
jgi:hypothetical protein